jgi:hypothetical protein
LAALSVTLSSNGGAETICAVFDSTSAIDIALLLRNERNKTGD